MQKIIKIYLTDKVDAKKEQMKKSEESEEIDPANAEIKVVISKSGKVSFLTKKEQEENAKIKKENAEKTKQFNSLKPYLQQNEEFRNILSASAKAQADHKASVTTATEESILFTIAESFMPGLVPSLLSSNSLIGGILRSFLGIPKAPQGHNPLATLNDTERGEIDTNAIAISKEILNNFKNQGYREKYEESDKKGKITTVLESEFGLPQNSVVHTASNINQEHKKHKLIISPDSKSKFSNIYSFLKSPNKNELNILKGDVSQKANIDSNGDLVKKATEIAEIAESKTDTGLGRAALKWIASADPNIENGHPEYSRLKGEIKFPIGYNVRVTAYGDIEVTWTEERGSFKSTPKTTPSLDNEDKKDSDSEN